MASLPQDPTEDFMLGGIDGLAHPGNYAILISDIPKRDTLGMSGGAPDAQIRRWLGMSMRSFEARTVLGLGPEADDEVVRAAYRALAKKYHPDNGGDPEEFRRIEEAYRVLCESPERPTEPREQTGGEPDDRVAEDLLEEILEAAEADWEKAAAVVTMGLPTGTRGTPTQLANLFAELVVTTEFILPVPDTGHLVAIRRQAEALHAAAGLDSIQAAGVFFVREFLEAVVDASEVWGSVTELSAAVSSYRGDPGRAAVLAAMRAEEGGALPALVYHAVWSRHVWQALWPTCTVVGTRSASGASTGPKGPVRDSGSRSTSQARPAQKQEARTNPQPRELGDYDRKTVALWIIGGVVAAIVLIELFLISGYSFVDSRADPITNPVTGQLQFQSVPVPRDCGTGWQVLTSDDEACKDEFMGRVLIRLVVGGAIAGGLFYWGWAIQSEAERDDD